MSRDEMAAALVDVAEGRLPKDRISLKWVWVRCWNNICVKRKVVAGI